ncbi:hypothetical protein Pla123a_30110 [Posidoniimonas polymericola]|uniref:Uncharacterized protein n=1 Tax=Posidoniimonas polymericola TaxID=2528002 RepID=A0A5C5YKV4_9BACT|nr:hypothetical protein Pla123a_30110 [Posidoniimonas polymericola]
MDACFRLGRGRCWWGRPALGSLCEDPSGPAGFAF